LDNRHSPLFYVSGHGQTFHKYRVPVNKIYMTIADGVLSSCCREPICLFNPRKFVRRLLRVL